MIRDRFVFLNQLISTQLPAQAAGLFQSNTPAVHRIVLRKTSKYLTPKR